MQSRRDVQRQKSRVSGKQVLIRSLMTVLVLILVAWGSFAIATQPKTRAQRQAVSLAKKYADLRSFDHFYVYNRDHTYYTVSGQNRQHQPILVIVPQTGGKLRVVKQASGLTSQQAVAKVRADRAVKRVLKVAPGIFNDRVVWEVTYKNAQGALCYDLLSFKTGHYVQRINNL